MRERNYTIDFLRLVASSWVVLFHLNEPIERVDSFYGDVTKLGSLGVPIFFVISGYCIALASHYSKGSLDFLIKRFFRIFPMYWASLLIVIVCVLLFTLIFGQNSITQLPKAPWEVTATLTLLTSPFSSVQTVNWVYWSLTVEIFFYLVVGLTLYLNVRTRLCLLILISALSIFQELHNVYGLFFLREWPSFGMGFALFYANVKSTKALLPILLFLVNFASLLSLHSFDAYTITTIISFMLISASIYITDIKSNFFTRLGDCAYSVYLIHVPIGVYFFNYFKAPAVQKNTLLLIVYDLTVLALLLVIASFTFKYLELPGIRFGKKVASKVKFKEPTITILQS